MLGHAPIKCGPTEAKRAGRHRDVAFGLRQRAFDGTAFELFERLRFGLTTRVRTSAAARIVATSLSLLQGLSTKSVAPRFNASTASCTPPKAVISTTASVLSQPRMRASASRPDAPLRSPDTKFMSSRTASYPDVTRLASNVESGAFLTSMRANSPPSATRAARCTSGSSSMMSSAPGVFISGHRYRAARGWETCKCLSDRRFS